EPTGDVEGSALGFLFRGADRFPQCLLMTGVGLATAALTLTVALMAGTTGFSPGGGDAGPGPNAGAGNPQAPDWLQPKNPPKPDEGNAEPGLRAHWTFDEAAGNKAAARGPHGVVATVHGAKWVPGVRGTALQFDGNSDYVDLSNSQALNFAA